MTRAGPGVIRARPSGFCRRLGGTGHRRSGDRPLTSIFLRLREGDEATGAAGSLDVKGQFVGLAGERLELLHRADALDLAVPDDPRDELTGLDAGGLGRAA